mmetsp:Transcript_49067/g.52970  ORF Transcript_49067/g.52970 Transcript_49067/m.52970 type:complete len:190 (+) Transcript_49067:274-843(+)
MLLGRSYYHLHFFASNKSTSRVNFFERAWESSPSSRHHTALSFESAPTTEIVFAMGGESCVGLRCDRHKYNDQCEEVDAAMMKTIQQQQQQMESEKDNNDYLSRPMMIPARWYRRQLFLCNRLVIVVIHARQDDVVMALRRTGLVRDKQKSTDACESRHSIANNAGRNVLVHQNDVAEALDLSPNGAPS